MMIGIIYIIAFFISLPFLATWIVYVCSYKLTEQKIKSFHLAVYVTTPLYLVAVTLMIDMVIGISLTGAIVILLLLLLVGVLIFQWRKGTEVLLGKAIRLVWRLMFLLFITLYGLLIVTGIIQRIFFSV
ncbi:hypothetical protein CAI16_00500 [Virgibacillus dokdonensis]|uniref:DUF3397 domain-containing protein n=2 Tax=Virgibacillus TaxID=84406 RepID=A0A1M5NFJ1_9BACI|nr:MULTISPECIES: DUF3397 domain-containing protein [Virgibacillus]RFA37620.1 hypothetical protein CAI16_00500 [Virgibacillus dokdonensis]SHG88245.1 Protein of unknown function [Virgibacillus chiguensis]